MKHIIYIFAFFISTLTFAQNSNTISGYLSDFESSNEPLIMANVSIKEYGTEAFTDKNGFFKFDGIKAGDYTLVFSFIGYETKESKIKLTKNSATIKISLKPSTISFEDLNSVMASAGNN